MTILPVSADYRQTFDVRLPSSVARILLWWQPDPDSHWYVSVENPIGAVRGQGRRVVTGVPILPRRYSPNLYCDPLDDAHADTDPERTAWDHTHRLVWR